MAKINDDFIDLWKPFIWDCNLLLSLEDGDPQLTDICDGLEGMAIELKHLLAVNEPYHY